MHREIDIEIPRVAYTQTERHKNRDEYRETRGARRGGIEIQREIHRDRDRQRERETERQRQERG